MEGDQSETLNYIFKNNRAKIRPIIFIITYIVWTVRKIRHLIAESKYEIVIYTNYLSAVDIIKQITLISSNSDKFNLRLVRIKLYLFQYTLDIKYRVNKNNTVPDSFSRLTHLKHDSNSLSEDKNILENTIDEYYCYSATIIEISDKFKNNIKKKYDFEIKQKFYQQEISDVTVYAQLYMKFRYDRDHTSFLLNIDDSAFLNLY
jgi:hypothetical protein